MAKVTVPAGGTRNISTSAKWLSIINAAANFIIESSEFGTVVGETGRQYDLSDYSSVRFVNKNDFEIVVEYETANLRIISAGKGNVSVTNQPVVKSIIDTVNADVTVKNDVVVSSINSAIDANTRAVSAVRLESFDDMELNAGEKIKLVNENAERQELFLKNISAINTVIRVGSSKVSAINGYELKTNSVLSLNNGAEIWVCNTSNTLAKLSAFQVLQ